MGHNPMKGDPFHEATSHEIHVGGQALNHTDIMLGNDFFDFTISETIYFACVWIKNVLLVFAIMYF